MRKYYARKMESDAKSKSMQIPDADAASFCLPLVYFNFNPLGNLSYLNFANKIMFEAHLIMSIM